MADTIVSEDRRVKRRYRTPGMSGAEFFQWFFTQKDESDSGCWEWSRSRRKDGYGQIMYAGKQRTTHRLAYELAHGSIPDGAQINHRCHNRACINPDHLYAGSQLDNMRDTVRDGLHCFGDDHPGTKIPDADVPSVLSRLERGETMRSIADDYGCTRRPVRRIKDRIRVAART